MKATQYIVTFQDQSRKHFLNLESLAENLEEMDALNLAHYFESEDHSDYEAIWEGDHHAEPCLITAI